MKKHTIHTIFDSRYDHDAFKDMAEEWAACENDFIDDEDEKVSADDYPTELYYEDIARWADDERSNLNEEVDGVIIAYARLGLWDGTHIGYKVLGSNVRNVIDNFGCDDIHVYCDRYNIRANAYHHDGTNSILFRLCDKNKVNKVCNKIYGECSEKEFMRMTKTLVNYPKKVYGWK